MEKRFSEKPETNIFVEKYDLGTGFLVDFRQNDVFRVQTLKKSQKCNLRVETTPADPENMTQCKSSGCMPVHKDGQRMFKNDQNRRKEKKWYIIDNIILYTLFCTTFASCAHAKSAHKNVKTRGITMSWYGKNMSVSEFSRKQVFCRIFWPVLTSVSN